MPPLPQLILTYLENNEEEIKRKIGSDKMLIAKNKEGTRVFAENAIKGKDYFCPICGENIILRQGKVRIHHFSHKQKNICPNQLWEPESQRHLQMKQLMMKLITKDNDCEVAEYECPIGDYIADLYLETRGLKVAIECQQSPKSYEEIIKKTNSFRQNGVYTRWIFDYKNCWKGDCQIRLRDEMLKTYYKENDGLYFLIDEKLKKAELSDVERYSSFYNEDGEEQSFYKILKSTKWIKLTEIENFKFSVKQVNFTNT